MTQLKSLLLACGGANYNYYIYYNYSPHKTGVIRQQGPWRNIEDVEFATSAWVDWFNNRRLFEPIGNV